MNRAIDTDTDACLTMWAGCDETYHGGHECHRRHGHNGRHRRLCGATTRKETADV